MDPVSFLTWGEPVNGLRSALELIPEGGRRWRWLSHGTRSMLRLHVQNVSDEPVQLASLMWLSEMPVKVNNVQGDAVTVDSTWYSGVTPVVRIHLQPQQIVTFNAGNIGLAVSKERAAGFEHITNRTMVIPRGEYSFQATERFGQGFRMTDGQGKVLVPLDSDWQGQLVSGVKTVSISNEVIGCRIVDAVTSELVSGTTTNWHFIKPKSAESDETTVAHMLWGPNSPGEIYFTIPDMPEDIAQRLDRDELEIAWGVGGNSNYEPYAPEERIPLRQFFHEGPEAARKLMETIRLVPKPTETE